MSAELDGFDVSDGAAELLLNTGFAPPPDGRLEAALLDAVLDGQCARVTSIRSMPAQVAAALSPDDFFTSSTTGFVDRDDRTKRRRSEAINQLRGARSVYASIARERTFKAGHKGSTFPWVNTAAALYKHAGRCWLASEIAIIGAASPLSTAFVKKPGASAFGTTGHPSELVGQARANINNASWWRQQLDADVDGHGRAEWALALWSIASGEVVSELLTALERVLTELPQSRRRTILRAAEQIARSGWLKDRPVTGNSAEPALTALIGIRNSSPPGPQQETRTHAQHDRTASHLSLLSVARSGQWLKVDAQPVYR
jgi:hypothetical protein